MSMAVTTGTIERKVIGAKDLVGCARQQPEDILAEWARWR